MLNGFKLTSGSSTLLDLIRGNSEQLVVIGHGIFFFGIFSCLRPPEFSWIQNIAVLIFFLLSGFLITYSTIRKLEHNYSFKQYFVDQFSRIYSAFVPVLLFVLLIDFISLKLAGEKFQYHVAFNVKTFFGNLLMLQDFPFLKWTPFYPITSFGSARPFLALGVEWWIYLLFGYFVLVVVHKKLRLKNFLIIGLFSIVPLVHMVSGRGNGLFTYWLFGSMIYLIVSLNMLSAVTKQIKWVLLLCLIFAFIIMLAIVLLIDLFQNIEFSERLKKLIHIIAGFSCTLYLIHYSILDFVYTHFHMNYNPYLLFSVAFVVYNLVSFGVVAYTERFLTFMVKKMDERSSDKRILICLD